MMWCLFLRFCYKQMHPCWCRYKVRYFSWWLSNFLFCPGRRLKFDCCRQFTSTFLWILSLFGLRWSGDSSFLFLQRSWKPWSDMERLFCFILFVFWVFLSVKFCVGWLCVGSEHHCFGHFILLSKWIASFLNSFESGLCLSCRTLFSRFLFRNLLCARGSLFGLDVNSEPVSMFACVVSFFLSRSFWGNGVWSWFVSFFRSLCAR